MEEGLNVEVVEAEEDMPEEAVATAPRRPLPLQVEAEEDLRTCPTRSPPRLVIATSALTAQIKPLFHPLAFHSMIWYHHPMLVMAEHRTP